MENHDLSIGPVAAQKLRERVFAELKNTLVSHYAKEISPRGALRPEEIAVYRGRAMGAKYLINRGENGPTLINAEAGVL